MFVSTLDFLRKTFSLPSSDLLVPPRATNFNVPGRSSSEYLTNVISNRRENLKILQVAYGCLCQNASSSVDQLAVFDFGCAFSPIGQAYATENKLFPEIDTYLGVDIDPLAINWCRRITALKPEFAYARYDAEHEKYFAIKTECGDSVNRPAQFGELALLFGQRKFNLQISSSVFTHLYLDEFCEFLTAVVEHMSANAVLFNSVFLIDERFQAASTRVGARLGRPDRGFVLSPAQGLGGGCYITSPENPRASIGYGQKDLFDRLKAFRGVKCEAVLYGDWCGVQSVPLGPSYQDWIVLRKT